MSWSIGFIGKPENIVKALQETADKMQDSQSKTEFMSALPHLIGLVRENFNTNEQSLPMLKISASGSGYAKGEEQIDRSMTVTLERLYGTIV